MSRTPMYFLLHVDPDDPSIDGAAEEVDWRFQQIFSEDNYYNTVGLVTEDNRVIAGEAPDAFASWNLPQLPTWETLVAFCRQDANSVLKIDGTETDRLAAARRALGEELQRTGQVLVDGAGDKLTLYELQKRVESVQHLEWVGDLYPFAECLNDPYHDLPYFDLTTHDELNVGGLRAILILSVHC